MVKGYLMLISDFARVCGLSVDTVRFYIKRGLLTPERTVKGGANPYQIFSRADVEMARTVRLAQSLGFTLKDIEAMAVAYRTGTLTPDRGAQIMRDQLVQLEKKAAALAVMTAYVKAKIAWIEGGRQGDEPVLQAHPEE